MLFKRAVPHGSKNLLGNKDRKRLKNIILASYPRCSDADIEDKLLPKQEEVTVLKIQGSKLQIFFVGGQPLFFDVGGNGDLFPSIYAIARAPTMIDNFLVYPPASRFILGGADLMLPGVIRPVDPKAYGGDVGLLKGRKMGIRIYGNPIAFAVGRCLTTTPLMQADRSARGKALEVLHMFGDQLWLLGTRESPNNGFFQNSVGGTTPPFIEDTDYYPSQEQMENLMAAAAESGTSTHDAGVGRTKTEGTKREVDMETDDGWENSASSDNDNNNDSSRAVNVGVADQDVSRKAVSKVEDLTTSSAKSEMREEMLQTERTATTVEQKGISHPVIGVAVERSSKESTDVTQSQESAFADASQVPSTASNVEVGQHQPQQHHITDSPSLNDLGCNEAQSSTNEGEYYSQDAVKGRRRGEKNLMNRLSQLSLSDAVGGGQSSPDHAAATLPKVANLRPNSIDLFLELCLLDALCTIADDRLPQEASGVFSNMLRSSAVMQFHPEFRQHLREAPEITDESNLSVCCGAVGVSCDLKKSSFKKLSKFMQFHSKQKVIQTKEVRSTLFVTSINRKHPRYSQFVVMTDRDRKDALKLIQRNREGDLGAAKSAIAVVAGNAAKHAAEEAARRSVIKVVDLYQPDSNAQPIFEAVGAQPAIGSKYYHAVDCRQILNQYIERISASQPNSNFVQVDATLARVLLSRDERTALSEKGAPWPTIAKSEAYQRFISSLQHFHIVNSDGMPAPEALSIRRGRLKPIQIRLEKRQGRKVVTKVENLHSFDVDEKGLAECLQRSLAASATTAEVPGAAKGRCKPLAVFVQGSFQNEVAEILATDYRIPKKYIDAFN